MALFTVNDYDWSVKRRRGGIIPFKEEKDGNVFFLSVQRGNGTISDFGGHNEKTDSDMLSTILREYREESNNCFGIIRRSDVEGLDLIDTGETVDIFYPVDEDIEYYRKKFSKKINNEVADIIEVSEREVYFGRGKLQGHELHKEIHDVFLILRNLNLS